MSINQELYALAGDLREAEHIPLYSADIGQIGNKCKGLLLRRDEVGTFPEPREVDVAFHEGKYFAEAISAPGNQTTYPYMLMKKVGALNRQSGEIVAVDEESTQLVGATKWDLMKVDQRVGNYYVTMRRDDGKSVSLLGPFLRHVDALLRVQSARNHVIDSIAGATWFSFGTARVDAEKMAPAGKLNGVLLSEVERHSLLSPLTPDANCIKIYGTVSAAMREAYDNLVALGVSKHYFTPKGAREYADEAMLGTLSISQLESGAHDLLQAGATLRSEYMKMQSVVNGLVSELSAQIAKMNDSITDPDFHHKPLPDFLVLEASLEGLEVKSKDSRSQFKIVIRKSLEQPQEGETRYVAGAVDGDLAGSLSSRPCTLVEAVCWASNVLHAQGDSWKPERQTGHETPAFRMK